MKKNIIKTSLIEEWVYINTIFNWKINMISLSYIKNVIKMIKIINFLGKGENQIFSIKESKNNNNMIISKIVSSFFQRIKKINK